MNPQARIPRSRGGITGLLLILLGAWGGLAPFVGPYFNFGYTPDKAWAYNSGRLYYSVVPGAAALLGGLLVLATRNRGVGVVGGVLAALGGAWFVLGNGITTIVLKQTAISIGAPISTGYSGALVSASIRMYGETAALFSGVGVLILFCGALAAGRFSLLGAQDVPVTDDSYYADYPATPAASQPGQYSSSQYPTTAGQFPSASQYPSGSQYPTSPGYTERPFPDTTTTQYPPESTG
jgi:hypothetical protein